MLYAPLMAGGFGFPNLNTRFSLRFVQGIIKSLMSRNAWVSGTTRWLISRPAELKIQGNDAAAFHELCSRWALGVALPPHMVIQPTSPSVRILRSYANTDVCLVSDGSSPEGVLSWGALLAHEEGIIATCHDGIKCDISYSWAAEWAGKLAALKLARTLGVPNVHLRWSIADNVGLPMSRWRPPV